MKDNHDRHEYYLKNRRHILERSKTYYYANPERMRAKARKYYANNLEKKAEQSHDSYMRHKEQISQGYYENKPKKQKYNHDYYIRTRKEHAEWNRAYTQRIRLELINMVGGITCSNPECPIPPDKLDFRGIHLDHINGDAIKDKRMFKNSQEMYRHYIRDPKLARATFRPYCAYCNWMKRQTEKEYMKRPEKIYTL